jgi:hypothetical protein
MAGERKQRWTAHEMNHNRALDAAIALSRTPTHATAMRAQALPSGVKLLLRILARDADALIEARTLTGLCDKDILVIAELYVLQVMLYRNAPVRRILGADVGANRAEIRGHMRLLLSWLHPDKNPSQWHSVFASRVIAAWRSIDRGREDEPPRIVRAAMSRCLPLQRVPWIALRAEPTSVHIASFWQKAFLIGMMGIALVGGGWALNELVNEVGRAIFPTLFAESPDLRTVQLRGY